MPFTFEQPVWLLSALVAVPLILLGWMWFNSMNRARKGSAVALRTLLLGLIAMILAGASTVHTTDKLAVIAVVDVSESVRQFAEFSKGPDGRERSAAEVSKEWLLSAVRGSAGGPAGGQAGGGAGPDDLFGVIVFDGVSAAASLPRPVGLPGRDGQNGASETGSAFDFALDYRMEEGSALEQALRLAAAAFPPDAARRIVLISDGNETEGDALAAARELGSGGAGAAASGASGSGSAIPIDVLPVSYRVKNEVMVEAVDVPAQAPASSSIVVRVVLNSTGDATGSLELLYEDEATDLNGPAVPGTAVRVNLRPGRNIETFQVPLASRAKVHRFKPIFIPDAGSADRIASNNSAEAFTITPGTGSVLIVDGVGNASTDSPGRILSRTLSQGKIECETIAPDAFPTDPVELQGYDLVILQDVAAEEIPRQTQKLLADYVSDLGGGLVMVGGPDSFGAGGWKGTPIEPLLPVRLDLPEQLLVPSAAVILILDNSGSMSAPVTGGRLSQQEVANEGAALAIQTLDKTDLVGVIAFNSSYDIVVPLERNSDARASADRVRSIASGGGTNLYPALAEAGQMLQRGEAAKAAVRHIIVLSDGRSEGDPNAGIAIARSLREQGISVSAISVGIGADDPTLNMLAVEGGGQFYDISNPNTLPKVFLKEVRVVRKPLIREAPFAPVDTRVGSPLTAGLPAGMPQLGGLVLTQRKNDPKITLALTTSEREPVLAHWFVGRGRVAAFTSDAHDWASKWLDWPGYSAFWLQVARVIARPAAGKGGELTTEFVGSDLLIRFDAFDDEGAPIDLLTVNGSLYLPGGDSNPISLSQVGPGAYEARVPAPDRGNYFVTLIPKRGDQVLAPAIGGASRATGAETRSPQSNIGLLREISTASGGRLLDWAAPESAGLFDRGSIKPVTAASPIWRLLLMWAIAVFIMDVATRRIAWDRLLSREQMQLWREEAEAAVKSRSERAAATAAALRRASSRVADQPGSGQEARRDEVAAGPRPSVEKLQATLDDHAKRVRRQMQVDEDAGRSAAAAALKQPEAPKADQDASTTAGLLAAKRRAKSRLDAGESP